MSVTQLPGGQITNVELGNSCGSPAINRSVIQAIRKSDPLPRPQDDTIFQSQINFIFKPDQ